MHFNLLTNPCFLCRRIIRHGIACLRLRKMLLLLMIARNGRQPLELCCRGKYPVLTVASKNLTHFFKLDHVCLNFLISNLTWLGSNIFQRMRRIRSRISVTGCRMIQKQLLNQPRVSSNWVD